MLQILRTSVECSIAWDLCFSFAFICTLICLQDCDRCFKQYGNRWLIRFCFDNEMLQYIFQMSCLVMKCTRMMVLDLQNGYDYYFDMLQQFWFGDSFFAHIERFLNSIVGIYISHFKLYIMLFFFLEVCPFPIKKFSYI